MTVRELKIDILSKNLKNLYIFYGDEYTVQKVYISKIAESTQSELQYIESLAEIKEYSGQSLFGEKKCFVCVDNAEIVKSNNLKSDFEKIVQILGLNCLILTFSKLDKRSKFYNFIRDFDMPFGSPQSVEFDKLHPVVIEKHLKEVIDAPASTLAKLREMCEDDYGRCLLEADKVKNYAQALDLTYECALFELIRSGTIYQPPQDAIFDFVNAVLDGKPRLAFDLLQECKEIGEPSLRLLLVLFTNVKHLLQVQSCEKNVEKTTGLSSWEIRNVERYQGIYRNSELVNAMKLIRDTEVGIKTGKIDESIAVEYVLVNMM